MIISPMLTIAGFFFHQPQRHHRKADDAKT